VTERNPPAGLANVSDAVVIKRDNLFLLSRPDGRLAANGRHPFGLWFRDCRFLSEHELRVAGTRPALLASSDARGTEAVHELGNPGLSLLVRLVRHVDPGGVLRERITVRSHQRAALRLPLALRLDADFEPMLVLRGLVPRLDRPEPVWDGEGFSVLGRDGVRRRTAVSVSPPPSSRAEGELAFELELDPGGTVVIELVYAVSEQDGPSHSAAPGSPVRAPAPPIGVTSDDRVFNRALERSMLDLELLRSDLDGRPYYAAGIPWFATLFGRDSLIAGLQALSFAPDVAEGTLRLLASRLGRRTDDARDEQPGKVLHELRVGEPAALGETPFARHYGSVDSTPLFLSVLCRHCAWSGSLDLYRELRGAVDAALEWIDVHGDLDGDGLVEYRRRPQTGLANVGWKDSPGGVPDEHGEPVAAPVALVEVQGYVLGAKRELAGLLELDGQGARAERLRTEAAGLEQALDRFRLDGHGPYAIALDGEKRPGSGLASNQGHLLWAGALTGEDARGVRDVLMSPDLFSGWGVRTLAASHPAYNPLGYHVGTVWPHDNAMIAAGLRRYGFDEDFAAIFDGLLEAASRLPGIRLPELFAGYPRSEIEMPVPCPVACRPQAWAAGSIPYLLASGLGLCPDGLERRLRVVRPSLPDCLGRVELTGLRVAGATIDLRFERSGGELALADARVDGDVDVVFEPGALTDA
jgi:glycogen debranching enzyme